MGEASGGTGAVFLPDDLAKLSWELVKKLKDNDAAVRQAACRALDSLPVDEIAKHSSQLVKTMMEDPDAGVRRTACGAFGKLSPHELAEHSSQLVKKLEDSDADVRCAACRAMSNLLADDLAKHSSDLVTMLKDPDAGVCGAACEALGNLRPIELARQSVKLVEFLVDTNFDLQSSSAIFRVPIQSAPSRDTWLHIAARHGSFEVCRAVLHGRFAALAQRNSRNQTASDVAAAHGHKELAEELKPEALQTRGGTGAAFAKAWDCEDVIEEVSWWVLPFPGMAGRIGAVHSMLRIKAGEKWFLIEGACPQLVRRYGETKEEIEQAAENGLFVSEWSDVQNAPNLRDLHGKQLWGDHLGNGITPRSLIEHLLTKGRYNTGSNNAHHTAFHGYNFCVATKGMKLRKLPVNYYQTMIARASSKVGIDVGQAKFFGQAIPLASPLYSGVVRDENFTGEIPRTWTDATRDGFVDVARHSDEWRRIEKSLKENGGAEIPDFQIEKIRRNQNLEMLKDFRNELGKVHGQRRLQLLHAPGAAHDLVAERGFANAYANMNFNAYGAGFYFAQDLRLPDFFATGRGKHPGQSEARHVLLCCVAAGKSAIKQRIFPFVPGDPTSGQTKNRWQAELSKAENRKAPDGFESCISDTHDELIVYEARQIYVEYSIQYKSSEFAGNPYDDLRGSLKEIGGYTARRSTATWSCDLKTLNVIEYAKNIKQRSIFKAMFLIGCRSK